jgi:hypothetical protein
MKKRNLTPCRCDYCGITDSIFYDDSNDKYICNTCVFKEALQVDEKNNVDKEDSKDNPSWLDLAEERNK